MKKYTLQQKLLEATTQNCELNHKNYGLKFKQQLFRRSCR